MDEFARLRWSIYTEGRGEDWESVHNAHLRLGRALLGEWLDEDIVTAAALRITGPGEHLFDLIPKAGASPYIDRYLADAVRAHPEVGGRVDEFLNDLAHETGVRPVLLRLAAAAGRRPFPVSLIDEELKSSCTERVRAALLYAVEAGESRLVDTIAGLADDPAVGEDAREALMDLGRGKDLRDERPDHPVFLVQSMFYGDPSRMGRGNSGGIGNLLRELGSSMSAEIRGVVTLVPYNRCGATYPFVPVERVGVAHSIVRFPVCLARETAHGFLEAHHQIGRAFARAMNRYGLAPRVVHVRFLDDASLAVARQAQAVGARLVVTVTPDPHRTLCDAGGNLRRFPQSQALEHFNKVLAGDELIRRARGLLAIGRETVARELISYYPQLEDTRGHVLDGIDEGVRLAPEHADVDVERILTRRDLAHHLAGDRLSQPALVSVGRLAPVKNQTALVRGWAHSLWRTHNLILIGGDHDNPSAEEREIMQQIAACVDRRPELEGRFCHLPASANAVVRRVLTLFAERSLHPQFDLYVCPSRKEEFGLSILEAMASGMVVCAPLLGGARTYVRHGINGFLVDTRDHQALESELRATVLAADLAPAQLAAIRKNAVETIRRDYSMESVAHHFADFYRRVEDE